MIHDPITALKQLHHRFPLPDVAGVYIFEDLIKETVLYVGSSCNLRKRLNHHERGYLRRAVGVRCRIVPCRNYKQVEKWLTALLKPLFNGVSVPFRKHQNLINRNDLDEMYRFVSGVYI